MLIVYASKTGNVRRFVESLNMKNVFIDDIANGIVNEPFILVTYTTGIGQIPSEVEEFLKHNGKNLVAVGASGNRNWRENFAMSANKIAYIYSVPILLKFEDDGEVDDREKFKERVHKINAIYRTKQ